MRVRLTVAAAAAVSLSLGAATPAFAHDHGLFVEPPSQDVEANPIGEIARTLPDARLKSVAFAAPEPGKPERTTFSDVLTRNPDTSLLMEPGFTTPDDECAAPVCKEIEVQVAQADGPTALYARVAWANASQYVHIWGISPDDDVIGQADVDEQWDKTVGNERVVPISEFTVADPAPGTWRIQIRAVFGHEIPVSGLVAVTAGKALELPRVDVRELADKHLTQNIVMHIVFVNRDLSEEELATFREYMPLEYRLGVLSKQSAFGDDGEDGTESVRNWKITHYSGTSSEDAQGQKPYFEPAKFNISYRFLKASDDYASALFAQMASVTEKDQPFLSSDQTTYLAEYDAERGKRNRGPDAAVLNPTVGDKIDAFAVEDWIFATRAEDRFAKAFTDMETGEQISGRFINPDPGAYYDPFYGNGTNLDRAPQGPSTSMAFFVLDTFNGDVARSHFRTDAYHFFDVSQHMIDPDVDAPDGPDYSRVWGGRYRFFIHDVGAGPNFYEAVDFFIGAVPGSAAYPDGDPPVWDYDNDPQWSGKFAERTARDAYTMLLYRLLAPYLYRPKPADVYFLAASNWNDCYANPECSVDGITYTDLERVYRPDYVEGNLRAAMPGVTFTTERSDPTLKTFRDLGCAKDRAVSNPDRATIPGGQTILVPDPNCLNKKSDPIQEALELAKARGDDVIGVGVNDAGVSGNVMRKFVEENRAMIAPQPPGQLTLTNISVVFPGISTWYLPAIVGGVALGTPNDEPWGILNNINERVKGPPGTDCSRSKPLAPGCDSVPAARNPGNGFSYTVQHEASHFLGLLHPHDSLTVEKDEDGKWQYYGNSYRHYGDFSMAPTTYAGSFAPYSVIDQDIIQRGHAAEYLRQVQDYLGDAYLLDGAAGLSAPSALTQRKVAEATTWRTMATELFACGDYLHSERAMRNASLAAQGIFGPVVAPRALQPGENVLFTVTPQTAYAPDGSVLPGCLGGAGRVVAPRPPQPPAPQGPLPATGAAEVWSILAALVLGSAVVVRRRRLRAAA